MLGAERHSFRSSVSSKYMLTLEHSKQLALVGVELK